MTSAHRQPCKQTSSTKPNLSPQTHSNPRTQARFIIVTPTVCRQQNRNFPHSVLVRIVHKQCDGLTLVVNQVVSKVIDACAKRSDSNKGRLPMPLCHTTRQAPTFKHTIIRSQNVVHKWSEARQLRRTARLDLLWAETTRQRHISTSIKRPSATRDHNPDQDSQNVVTCAQIRVKPYKQSQHARTTVVLRD
jgi:hypothetical protein